MASDRTGSGKTFAYSIPIIERLRENGAFNNYDRVRNPKFIVLCPTRELAVQVCQEISKLS